VRVSGQPIGTAVKIVLHHPRLIPSLFTGDFDKIYCSYWAVKLKEARKTYDGIAAQPSDLERFMSELKAVNEAILTKNYSRIEAFYIPLYMLIRFVKPQVVVETGVHRGVSSLFILQAMSDNGEGQLYSIDLPHAQYESDSGSATKSVLHESKIGICVPAALRDRWKLILGDSREELPALLAKVGEIDIFLHDSKHTFDHMMWEFQTAWPHITANGFLLSDDIHWSNAFAEFSSKVKSDKWEFYRDRQSIGTGKFGIILKRR